MPSQAGVPVIQSPVLVQFREIGVDGDGRQDGEGDGEELHDEGFGCESVDMMLWSGS